MYSQCFHIQHASTDHIRLYNAPRARTAVARPLATNRSLWHVEVDQDRVLRLLASQARVHALPVLAGAEDGVGRSAPA